MPHSTGGGGSHGGSHHSSHGGSHGGSGSSIHYYNSYIPGRHVWVSYVNGQPHYRYTNSRYKETSVTFYVIFFLIFFCTGLSILSSAFPPKKVTVGQTPLTMEDDAKIFSKKEERFLSKAVSSYYDKSGIPVTIKTVKYKKWLKDNGDYGQSKENYAYDTYVGMYLDDETRWLIMIWDGEAGDSRAYSFEGIAGDRTNQMLPEETTSKFNSIVSYQLRERYGRKDACSQAFITGFNSIGAAGFNWINFGVAAFWLLMTCGCLIPAIVKAVRNKRIPVSQREHEVDTHGQAPQLVTCPYCGGTYVFGETACPHCNAAGLTVYTPPVGTGESFNSNNI